MDSNILTLTTLLFFLEMFEIFWQKGSTVKEYIGSLLYFYKKNILLFFVLHPSFYFVVFCSILLNNTSALISSIIIAKMLDIIFKITLLDRLLNQKPLGFFVPLFSQEFSLSLGVKLTPLLLYPTLFSTLFLDKRSSICIELRLK